MNPALLILVPIILGLVVIIQLAKEATPRVSEPNPRRNDARRPRGTHRPRAARTGRERVVLADGNGYYRVVGSDLI